MNPQSVSLVLGSGGARGLAQIGVIRWLEEHATDYTITSIAGSSMGSVVGGIYAAGELEAYERWVRGLRRQDVWRLLDLSFSGAGLFRGARIMEQLRELIGDVAIEDLPITFTAVATDIRRKREVWLKSGSLFDAIRASIAIPSVFTPVEHDGRLLVDGGLLNPVPISPTLADSSDVTITVSLSGRTQEPGKVERQERHEDSSHPEGQDYKLTNGLIDALPDQLGTWLEGLQERLGRSGGIHSQFNRAQEVQALNFIDIIAHSIEAMQGSIARHRMAAYTPDHIIEIPVDACGMLDFHRADEMIELGYRLAEEAFGTH